MTAAVWSCSICGGSSREADVHVNICMFGREADAEEESVVCAGVLVCRRRKGGGGWL